MTGSSSYVVKKIFLMLIHMISSYHSYSRISNTYHIMEILTKRQIVLFLVLEISRMI